jgi:nucleoside-diphosphate kinase
MCEGPILVMVLVGERAIQGWREVMGDTDPSKAGQGTIRSRFGQNVERNSVHGSDSPETAHFEVGYFFGEPEKG